jgi:hypothetical protein
MKTFVNASKVKPKKNSIDPEKLDFFIDKFNKYIKKGGFYKDKSSDVFHLNNSLDKVPTLNKTEFERAKKLAQKQGWELTQDNDNYQTITYRMEKMIS